MLLTMLPRLDDTLKTANDLKNTDIFILQESMSSLDLSLPSSTSESIDASPATVSFASLLLPSPSVSVSPLSSASLQAIPATHEHRRQLRRRSTDGNLHRINRRVISKPMKNSLSLGSSESEIRKIYMCKKLTKVKSTCLETIFEENDSFAEDSMVGSPASTGGRCPKLIGIKKLKRSLSCSDGYNVNKATTKKRKGRICKFLGKSRKGPKFSMEFFLSKLHSMQSDENVSAEDTAMVTHAKSD